MGLEAPLALLGLAAALLPWLAHRIRRRDLTPSPLPTFALLQQAEAHKRQSRGLTDLLLLALRTALCMLACFAIAAPFATASLSFGDGSIASAAIVIDDSLSMSRKENGETLLAAAIARARQAVASLPDGSELVVIAAGQRARVLARRSTDLALGRAAIERIPEHSMRGTDLKGAIKLALQQLEGARHPTRRLLVLSDFAAHGGLSREDVQAEGVQVVLAPLGATKPPPNVYFHSVRALPDPSAKGQTSIAVELAAYGDAPEHVSLSVESTGRSLATASLKLIGGRGREVIRVPTPDADADPTALVRLDLADAIEADNVAGVLLRPSDAIEVMLVNGDPHPGSERDELFYALHALRLSPGEEARLSLRTIDATALAKYDLLQADVVVLANAEAPDAASAERVTRFVEQGGGLIVSAGNHVQPSAYNAALSHVLPCVIRARAENGDVALAPGGSVLLGDGPNGLSQARARKRLLLDCDSQVHLRFADGAPALAETRVGRGRSALLAVSLDADGSDWPFRPGYLPLLTRLIREVAGAAVAIDGPVAAGAALKLAVPPGAKLLEVVGPEGTRERFDNLAGKSSVEFSATDSAGAYRVLAASERGVLADVPRGAFVVESPRAESDLTPSAGVDTWIEDAHHGGHASTQVKRSLSPFVLLLFAAFALLEGTLRLRTR